MKETQSLPSDAASPAVPPVLPENMSAWFSRLESALDRDLYEKVDELSAEGLYISKRPIVGAQGQGQLLNQAGTVFHHTLLYIKTGSQVTALDFGPQGNADVTPNVMEAAPSGKVVHEDLLPDANQQLLHVKLPIADLSSETVQKAIEFVESRDYHAINNNCIHNTDFLGRVLTGGRLKNGPLVFDALAGTVPAEDHPMLLMFFLMTQLSWFNVCDGSPLTAEFMRQQGWLPTDQQANGNASHADTKAEGRKQPVTAHSKFPDQSEQGPDLMRLLGALQSKNQPRHVQSRNNS